jgi:hypothetical protein
LTNNAQKIRYAGIALLFIAAVVLLEYTGFFEGINSYCYDLAFRMRGPREHDHRIVIAAIDDKSLAKLGRWPIRRSLYADLLETLNRAAAVGMDVIFTEPSEDDERLGGCLLLFVCPVRKPERNADRFAEPGGDHPDRLHPLCCFQPLAGAGVFVLCGDGRIYPGLCL